jgi:hypothetical protein
MYIFRTVLFTILLLLLDEFHRRSTPHHVPTYIL